MDGEMDILDRAYRGHKRFLTVHRQLTKGVAEGEQVVGVPVLSYPVGTSRKDRNVMLHANIDVMKIQNPQLAAAMVAGVCNVHLVELWESKENLKKLVALIEKQLAPAFGQQAAPAAPPPAALPIEADDEDEEDEVDEDEDEVDDDVEDEVDDDDEDDDVQEEAPPPPPPAVRPRKVRKAQA
jgi:hypothetical protein